MIWADLQTGLVDAIREALSSYTADVFWDKREVGWRAENHVRLSIVGIRKLGRAESRYAMEGLDIRESIYWPCVIAVQVLCETQRQSLEFSAWEMSEEISAMLESERGRQLLFAAGAGIATITNPITAEYTDEFDRVRSVASFDLQLNTHSSRLAGLIPVIEQVGVQGTVDETEIPEIEIGETSA